MFDFLSPSSETFPWTDIGGLTSRSQSAYSSSQDLYRILPELNWGLGKKCIDIVEISLHRSKIKTPTITFPLQVAHNFSDVTLHETGQNILSKGLITSS